MLKDDREQLKKLMMNYPSKDVMKELSSIAIEVAGELSDIGVKEMAKDYVKFSAALDDLISGRPFLI